MFPEGLAAVCSKDLERRSTCPLSASAQAISVGNTHGLETDGSLPVVTGVVCGVKCKARLLKEELLL